MLEIYRCIGRNGSRLMVHKTQVTYPTNATVEGITCEFKNRICIIHYEEKNSGLLNISLLTNDPEDYIYYLK